MPTMQTASNKHRKCNTSNQETCVRVLMGYSYLTISCIQLERLLCFALAFVCAIRTRGIIPMFSLHINQLDIHVASRFLASTAFAPAQVNLTALFRGKKEETKKPDDTIPFNMDDWHDFLWIVICAGIFAFMMAFGIGANDVANSFGTSVGSKTLTLKQAVMMAAVAEFTGAVTMGARVTKTVKDGITNVDMFKEEPETLMFVMMCALLGAGTWVLVASYFALPVSTTHSITGAVAGGALATKGLDGVGWDIVGKIVLSWVISPLIAGAMALTFFVTVRFFILRHEKSSERSHFVFPILSFAVFTINTFFIIYKGSPNLHLADIKLSDALGAAFGIGAGTAVISFLVAVYFLGPRIQNQIDAENAKKEAKITELQQIGVDAITSTDGYSTTNVPSPNVERNPESPIASPAPAKKYKWYNKGINRDVHESTVNEEKVREIHSNAEEFNPHTEGMFSYAQVMTAFFASFAHGANDVSNSIAPLAACIEIYRSHTVSGDTPVDIWILVLGGGGIVAGLALYGYNVIESLGVKITKITPSRGFCIELSTALVVVIASRYEFPISTTHCQVGGTMGAGISENYKLVNWWLLLQMIGSWAMTLLFSASVTALFVSFGYYSPSFNSIHY